MKITKVLYIATMAFTLFVSNATNVFGQRDSVIGDKQLADRMRTELGLTAVQYEQVLPVIQKAAPKIKAAVEQSADLTDLNGSLEKIIEEMDISLLEILDGDQWNTWLDLSKRIMKEIQQGERQPENTLNPRYR